MWGGLWKHFPIPPSLSDLDIPDSPPASFRQLQFLLPCSLGPENNHKNCTAVPPVSTVRQLQRFYQKQLGSLHHKLGMCSSALCKKKPSLSLLLVVFWSKHPDEPLPHSLSLARSHLKASWSCSVPTQASLPSVKHLQVGWLISEVIHPSIIPQIFPNNLPFARCVPDLADGNSVKGLPLHQRWAAQGPTGGKENREPQPTP